MRTSHLLVLCLLAVLAGCNTDPIVQTPPVVPETSKVVIDPSLLKPCDDLEELDVKKYTQGETAKALEPIINSAGECARNHKSLIDVVKKAFNLSWQKVADYLS